MSVNQTRVLREKTPACRYRSITVSSRILGAMAQRHKGKRQQIAALTDPRVRAVMVGLATRHGISVSQYVADLLAVDVGRPDLVRDLTQTTIPILDDLEVVVDDERLIAPRVHVDVYQVIAERAGNRRMGQYVARVCEAHANGHALPIDHATANENQEELLLTSA